MKNISPPVAGIIIAVVLVVLAGLFWSSWNAQAPVRTSPPSGPIVLPPSQQGTKLGGQTLGAQLNAPTARAPQSGK